MLTTGFRLFFAALLIRLVALALASATGHFPVFWEYESIARSILAGHGFVYTHLNTTHWAYAEPLYPFLVTAVYGVTGFSVLALGTVQSVISASLAPVTCAFGRRTFGPTAGLCAGSLIAVHPALTGYATIFHPLTIDALLLALVPLTLLMLVQEPSRRHALFFGAAAGACVLTRPTVITFLAAATAWIVWRRRSRETIVAVLAGIAVAAAIVAPWVVRNYAVLGSVVAIRSHVGFGLWQGNHPGAAGGEGDASDPTGRRSNFAEAPEDLRRRVLSADAMHQNAILHEAAASYIKAEPMAFVERTSRKFYYFWWFAPYFGKVYPKWQVVAVKAFYVMVLALAAVGGCAAWRHPVSAQADGVWLGVLLSLTI